MAKDWKDRLGVVYSTSPDYEYSTDQNEQEETLPPSRQKLIVSVDKNGRKGKLVTLVSGFIGTIEDLNELGKWLKVKCGVGGTVKGGEIMIQGDFRDRVSRLLVEKGYHTKISGK